MQVVSRLKKSERLCVDILKSHKIPAVHLHWDTTEILISQLLRGSVKQCKSSSESIRSAAVTQAFVHGCRKNKNRVGAHAVDRSANYIESMDHLRNGTTLWQIFVTMFFLAVQTQDYWQCWVINKTWPILLRNQCPIFIMPYFYSEIYGNLSIHFAVKTFDSLLEEP